MSSFAIFNMFPVLATERCHLVAPVEKDAEALFAIYGDEQTMQYMQRPTVRSIDECRELIAEWQENFQHQRSIRWAIKLQSNPAALIGTIALHYWSMHNKRVELGADINKLFWGKGISSEVTKAVIDFAFEEMDIHRLELRCDPRNTGSIVIANKFGFTYEGTLRKHVFVEEKGYVDESVYSLLREEYYTSHK